MLTGARALAAEARLDIDYHLGDAENLPFADNSFDGVISTFGVMFAPDQEAAIAELARVCKPGGRLAVAAWTAASTAVAMRQQMIPFMPTPPADAPVPPSPFNWADPDWLQTTLGADFDVACETGTTFTRYASAEAWWQLYTNSFGPTKGVADGLDEARRAELTAVMTEWMDGYKTDLGVALPIDYLVTLGRRKT